MRDIRPSKKITPKIKLLSAKSIEAVPPKKPAFRGSKVPVSNIASLPKEKVVSKDTIKTPKPIPPKPSKNPPRVKLSIGGREKKIILFLSLLTIIVVSLAAIIFLPSTKIQMVLRTAPLLIDEELILSNSDSTDKSVVPGTTFFREVKVSGESPVLSTEVIGKKTTGTVDLVNRSFDEQSIRIKSRLITKNGTLFYTQKAVKIPGAQSSSPARVSVAVEAAESGSEGNIDSQRLDFVALDESSRSLLYAEATNALTGGSGEEVPVIKQDDLEKAQKMAGDLAKSQIQKDVEDELPDGWVILDESWTAEIKEFKTEEKIGDREAQIKYGARVVVKVMGYESKVLEKKLKLSLEKHMDDNYMLFPGDISHSKKVKEINWEENKGVISVRVTHTTIPKLSLEALKDKLAGRSKEEASAYLEGLAGVRSVKIKLSPFWVKSISRIKQRISLDLVPERQP